MAIEYSSSQQIGLIQSHKIGSNLFCLYLNLGMGRNKCKDNKRNEFVAGFEKVNMNITLSMFLTFTKILGVTG